ncbi:Gfo/Idh/MocA family protein [Aquabacterium sp.]|uniref:Gfo/Idh/MocA family protein n=1 Tax=Aquabacterium sp. TaxID=1872578 RepID=UPI003784E454
MTEVLRLGILSTANIAHGFAEGLADARGVRIDAVASRNAEAAGAFAARHGIARSHARYEDLLADPAIDAIYNPLPNSLHAAWTEAALKAGKHVLCEKPLTLTRAEAEPLFALARESGLVLLEAFPYRYQPQTLRLRQLLAEGAIGQVRMIQAYFGFSLREGPNIRLDPALGGGALLDAGCYAVSFARLAAGAVPVSVLAQARWGDSGVDMALTGTVHYANGAVAQIGCAMDTAPQRLALVVGNQGVIETDYLNHTSVARPGCLRVRRGAGWDSVAQDEPYALANGFRCEAEHFARQVALPALQRDREDEALSLQNMATLEALLRSAREGRAVNLATA